MRTTEDVQQHLKGLEYPANLEALIDTARNNGAPPSFFELLGMLLSPAAESHNADEVSEHLARLKGLG